MLPRHVFEYATGDHNHDVLCWTLVGTYEIILEWPEGVSCYYLVTDIKISLPLI